MNVQVKNKADWLNKICSMYGIAIFVFWYNTELGKQGCIIQQLQFEFESEKTLEKMEYIHYSNWLTGFSQKYNLLFSEANYPVNDLK